MEQEGIAAIAHGAEDLLGDVRKRGAAPEPATVDLLLAICDALQGMVGAASRGEAPPADPALLDRIAEAVTGGGEAEQARGTSEAPTAPPTPTPSDARGTPSRPPPLLRRGHDRRQLSGPGGPRVPRREEARGRRRHRRRAAAAGGPARGPDPRSRAPRRRRDRRTAGGNRPGALADRRPRGRLGARGRARAPRSPGAGAAASPIPARARSASGPTSSTSSSTSSGELLLASARIREVGRALPEELRPRLDDEVDRLHGTVKDLHDKVMAVRMTPVALVTDQLPRAARDLARRVGKEVDVEVHGQSNRGRPRRARRDRRSAPPRAPERGGPRDRGAAPAAPRREAGGRPHRRLGAARPGPRRARGAGRRQGDGPREAPARRGGARRARRGGGGGARHAGVPAPRLPPGRLDRERGDRRLRPRRREWTR